jgi:hypothetical protein
MVVVDSRGATSSAASSQRRRSREIGSFLAQTLSIKPDKPR